MIFVREGLKAWHGSCIDGVDELHWVKDLSALGCRRCDSIDSLQSGCTETGYLGTCAPPSNVAHDFFGVFPLPSFFALL